jgi:hypothetical protein
VALAVRPAPVWAAWCRLRWGGAPSPTGVVLTLEPDEGTTVVAWLRNIGRAAAPVCWSDPPGDEWTIEVDGLAPRRDPGDATVAAPGSTLRRTWLPPGGRLGFRLDLSRWTRLPPGRYVVRVARAPWGDPAGGVDGLRCEAEPLTLDVR